MFPELNSPGKMTARAKFLQKLSAIPRRLLFSLAPPVTSTTSRVEVDFFGPLLILGTLWLVLELGRNGGEPIPPIVAMAAFFITVPPLSFIVLKAGQSTLTLRQVVGLAAYAQFGHLCTLCLANVFRSIGGHGVFFIALTFFGGLSAIRLVLLLTYSTRKPAVALLSGCLVSIPHLLFMLFTYFTYNPPLLTLAN